MDHFHEDPSLLYSEAELDEILMSRDEVKRAKKNPPPYRIVRSEVVGRHMVAGRKIKAGEVIFVESPLTFGPSENSKAVCLNCYKRLVKVTHVCTGCGFPMCSEACEVKARKGLHGQLECGEFRKNNFVADRKQFTKGGELKCYNVVSPLRVLLLRQRDPLKWRLVWSHMSHDAKRKESAFWTKRTKEILQQMETCVGLRDPAEVRTCEILLGILLVNDFEIDVGDESSTNDSQSIRGLFALASMPSHSCASNTKHDFDRDSLRMTMRAVIDIPEGEEITHSYADPLEPVLTRQGLLNVGKFFHCLCPRCSDPTELATFSSAVTCSKCKKGFLLSSDPNRVESEWRCNNAKCKAETDCNKVQDVIAGAKTVAKRLEPSPSNPSGASIDDIEKFVKAYSNRILHPNHMILIDKKYSLAKMYGRVDGYEADSMSDAQFERKMCLCREVLAVLDKIMPGRSRKRGMMLYELHLPLLMLANRSLQRGPGAPGVDPKKIKEYLKESLECLRASLDLLGDEPEGSFEHKIVEGSKASLKQLEDWVKTVCGAIK